MRNCQCLYADRPTIDRAVPEYQYSSIHVRVWPWQYHKVSSHVQRDKDTVLAENDRLVLRWLRVRALAGTQRFRTRSVEA
jgi:hypothetical protein